MHKKFYKKVKKYFLSISVILFFSVLTFASSPQKNNMDPATMHWIQRADVKNAVNQLQEAHLALDEYVQKIYNAYSPYTIGEGKVMRDRMKNLESLITEAGNFEGIVVQFKGATQSTNPYSRIMASLKKNIRFYYFDQELKNVLGWESNVIRQLIFALESLENPKLHPDFVRVTQFNKDEAMQLIQKLNNAIHAAVATIPGGSEILKFK